MESTITEHTHNGTDSKKVKIQDLELVKTALTTKNSSSLSSGGAYNLSTADSIILENMKTRLNELEAILQSFNLLN